MPAIGGPPLARTSDLFLSWNGCRSPKVLGFPNFA